MNCNFDKFSSLLSMYGVVIDTVLDNIPSGLEQQLSEREVQVLNEKIAENLGTFFSDYKNQVATQSDFLIEAAQAIYEATKMVKDELELGDAIKAPSYFFNNIFTNTRFPGLKQSLQSTIVEGNFRISLTPTEKLLINKAITGMSMTKGEMGDMIAMGSITTSLKLGVARTPQQITENYYGVASGIENRAKNKFVKSIYGIRFREIYLKPRDQRLNTLNERLKDYQKTLFDKMMLHPVFVNKDYTIVDRGAALAEYEEYLRGIHTTGIQTRDLIQWSLDEDKTNVDIYNAFVQLKHFDDVVTIYSGGLIEVNSRFKNLDTPNNKYLFSASGKMRSTYNADDDIISASDETSPLYRNFIQSLEKIDRNGKVLRGDYLNFEMVNYSMSLLKGKIDWTEPVESIKKNLEELIEDVLSNSLVQHQEKIKEVQLRTLITVYANVFRNGSLDNKPKLTELMENIDKLNPIDSLFPHHISSVTEMNDVNLVEIISSNLLKVDTLKYAEVIYNQSNRNYVHTTMDTKISGAQFYRLRVLGAKVLHRSANNFEMIQRRYNIVINTDTGKPVYEFRLPSNKSIYYHFHDFNPFFSEDPKGAQVIDLTDTKFVPRAPVDLDSKDVAQLQKIEYADYFHIVKMFDEILEQSLSADNFRGLDIFKDYSGDNLTQNMMAMLGNYIGLTHLNIEISKLFDPDIKGLMNLAKVKGAIAVQGIQEAASILNSPLIDLSDKVWSKRNRYYNIDLGGTHSGVKNAMQEYSTALNMINKVSIKAVVKNSLGKMLPTYAITNSINNYNVNVQSAKADINSVLNQSLYVQNSDSGLLAGMEIRSTVKNAAGDVFHPSKLNELELLKTMILQEFLSNRLSVEAGAYYRFQPTNFADKSRHTNLMINPEATIRVGKDLRAWKDITPTQFQDLFFKNQFAYYSSVTEVIFEDYAKIFNATTEGQLSMVAKNYLEGSSVLKFLVDPAGKLIDIKNIDKYPDLIQYKGDTLYKEYDAFNALSKYKLKYRDQQKRKYNVHQDKEVYDKLNAVIKLAGEKALVKSLNEAKVDWYNNLYFEKGLDEKVQLNQSLSYYLFDYFHPDNKANTIKKIEKNFVEKLESFNFKFDLYGVDHTQELMFIAAERKYKTLELQKDADGKPTSSNFKDLNKGVFKLTNGDGELNPILKDYLWQNLLATREFQLLTVGSPLGHPVKVKTSDLPSFIDQNDKEAVSSYLLSLRLVAQNKRMVKHQATFHPYMQNMINGVANIQNRIYLKDPSVTIFTPNGMMASVDIADGASIATLLEINLMNASLLDQAVGNTHKSIGGDVDPRTGAAGLTKHALHGITNMDIQNSPDYKMLMLKLLGKRFTILEGTEINVDITKDFQRKNIDLSNTIGDVFFVYDEKTHNLGKNIKDGTLVKFVGIKNIGKDSYDITYEANGAPFTVNKTIDNLHQLWTALGAEFSMTFDENEIGKWRKGALDGYVQSNSSWDALTVFVNKVGFYDTTIKSPKGLTIADSIVTNDASYLRQSLEKYFKGKSRKAEPGYKETRVEDMLTSQKNIIQPLKINNVGQVTFSSGQKVGVQNAMTLKEFLNVQNVNNVAFATADTTQYGIQLNADHDIDEHSFIKEPTQIISTASFSGNISELTDNIYTGIANYIRKNMEKYNYVDTSNMDSIQYDELNDFMKRIVMKAFRDQDLGGFSNLIVQAIEEERSSGIKSSFKIPASSAQFNTMINTTIANVITDEGVKRVFPGVAAVAKPYSGFIKFKTVVDGGVSKTMTQQQYNTFLRSNPDFKTTEVIDTTLEGYRTGAYNNIDLMDTVIDPNGNEVYLDNPITYYETKMRIMAHARAQDPAIGPWSKKLDAEHDLKPPRHTFRFEGMQGFYSLYDLPSIMFKYILDETVALKSQLEAFDKSSPGLSQFEMVNTFGADKNATPENNRFAIRLRLFTDLTEKTRLLKDLYVRSGFNVRYLANIETLLDRKKVKGGTEDTSLHPLTEKETNYLKNFNTQLFQEVHKKKHMPVPLTMPTELAPEAVSPVRYKLSELKAHLGQAAIATPYRDVFGLGADQDVHDVTEDSIYESMQNATVPKQNVAYDFFFREKNGAHAYFVLEGSGAYEKLMAQEGIVRKSLDVIEDDGILYNVDLYGRKTSVTPSNEQLLVPYGNSVLTYYVIDKKQAALENTLKLISSEELTTRFTNVTFKLSLDSRNIPLILKAAAGNFNVGLSATQLGLLSQTYEDYSAKKALRTDDISATLVLYDAEWAEEQTVKIQQELGTAKVIKNKSKLNNLTSYLKLLNSYKTYLAAGDTKGSIKLLKEIRTRFTDESDIAKEASAHVEVSTDMLRNTKRIFNNVLKEIEKKTFERQSENNKYQAKVTYVNFKKSLEIVGARIPGQDLQSYMGMEIVHFLNGQANAMHVSPWHQLYTGEDFDIDKVFTLFYSLDRSGKIKGWSTFWNSNSTKMLDLSLTLPLPENITKETVPSADLDVIMFKDAELEFLDKLTEIDFKKIAKKDSLFEAAVNLINKARANQRIILSVSQNEKYAEKVSQIINGYHNTTLPARDLDLAFLNLIQNGLIENETDIRNVPSAHSPMGFDNLPQLSQKSKKGETLAKISYENPADIVVAQYANALGKDAIGIVATGLKGWSVIGNALINIKEAKKSPFKMQRFPVLKLKNATEDGTSKIFEYVPNTGFTGINIGENLETFLSWLQAPVDEELPDTDFKKQINMLNDTILRDSNMLRPATSLKLSALLSAATDNAKELILDRINANPQTLSYFIAMLSLGMDLTTVFYVMTSDLVETALQVSTRDLYTGKNISFAKALTYVSKGKIEGSELIDRNTVNSLIWALNDKKAPFKDSKNKTMEQILMDAYVDPKLKNSEDPAVVKQQKMYIAIIKSPKRGLYNYLDLIMGLKDGKADATYQEIYNYLNKVPIKTIEIADSKTSSTYTADVAPREGYEPSFDAYDYEGEQIDPWEMEQEFLARAEQLEYEMGQLAETDQDSFGNKKAIAKVYAPFSYILEKASAAKVRSFDDMTDLVISNQKFPDNTDDRAKNIGYQLALFEFLADVNILGDDITKLATTASINQGVSNRLPELFTWLKDFSDYVRENFKLEEKYPRFVIGGPATTMETLNLIFKDKSFQDDILLTGWTGEKSKFDIVAVLKMAPHTWEMMNSAFKAFELMYTSSALNRFQVQIMENLKFKKTELPIVGSVSNDYYLAVLLQNLKSLDADLVSVNVRKGDMDNIVKDAVLDISNINDRELFLEWFETSVIPNLKMGYIKNDLGNYEMENGEYMIHPVVGNNYFVKRLVTDQVLDKSLVDTYMYYKLPVDISRVDPLNLDSQLEVDALKAAFAGLEGVSYDGKRLTDLFAMYDFIVQKDKDNSNSYKRLVAAVDSDLNKNSFAVNLLRATGDLDQSDFDVNLNPTENPEVLETLAAYGYGQELPEVPQTIHKGNIQYMKPIIKVLSKDVEEDLWIWKYYGLAWNSETQTGVYNPIEHVHSKKTIPVSPQKGVTLQKDWDKQKGLKKDRITKYLNNFLILNIKDC